MLIKQLSWINFLTGIECMQKDCHILVPEDFLCNALSKPELRDKYTQLSFTDHVKVKSMHIQRKHNYSFLPWSIIMAFTCIWQALHMNLLILWFCRAIPSSDFAPVQIVRLLSALKNWNQRKWSVVIVKPRFGEWAGSPTCTRFNFDYFKKG